MRVYEGIVKDQVVLLPNEVRLEDGLRVEVRVPKAGEESREEIFKRKLLEAGLLEEAKGPSRPLAEEDRVPIQVRGKPLSELIMEERR